MRVKCLAQEHNVLGQGSNPEQVTVKLFYQTQYAVEMSYLSFSTIISDVIVFTEE